MYKLIEIVKSTKADKKWMAIFEDSKTGRRKTTHFGSAGMDDYTITKNAEQAERYKNRHQKDLKTNDPTRAGYLSYYLLWDSPDFKANVRNYKKQFNL